MTSVVQVTQGVGSDLTQQPDAFRDIVDQHGMALFRLAYVLLGDPARAEDAVQDSLFRAWRNVDTIRDQSRLGAWLSRTVINACRDELRRERRRSLLRMATFRDQTTPDAAHDIANRDEIVTALRRLSSKQREILVLRYYSDLEPKAIAEDLGIPEGTVRSRLHAALGALRAALAADARWERR